MIECRQQRIFDATFARATEVVQIQSPDHAAAQIQVTHEIGLFPNVSDVIVRHPLIAMVCVWSDAILGVANNGPFASFGPLAYLIE